MLNMYNGSLINSTILEPSFGDGQFLQPIVKAIIKEAKSQQKTNKDIAKILNNNIFGRELDPIHFETAIINLNAILTSHNIPTILWSNLKNDSVFNLNSQKYDLIIGNPPYVRIQNLQSDTKDIKSKLSLTSGNTDLFLMFMDFLFTKLKTHGVFIFIVPNSLGTSKSASKIREYMIKNGKTTYIDYEDEQLFDNASVYSAIFKYEHNINGDNLFLDRDNTQYVMDNTYFTPVVDHIITKDYGIKNGIATLADSIFIIKVLPTAFEQQHIKRIYKGSKQDQDFYAIFPYKVINGVVSKFDSEAEFKQTAPNIFAYLTTHKSKLVSRSLERNGKWFEYGRSQAIKDVAKPKILINTLIKPGATELQTKQLPGNTLVYSGLYTTSDDFLKINTPKLIKSLRFRAKDMRGGYKMISSGLLKNNQ